MKEMYESPKVECYRLYSLQLLSDASIDTGDLYGDGEEFTNA